VSNPIEALRRGIKAGVEAMQSSQPGRFQAGGKTIVCTHCGNDIFEPVGMVGMSVAGYGIACSKCTRIDYFRSEPSPVA
jgi:hypothetical protein